MPEWKLPWTQPGSQRKQHLDSFLKNALVLLAKRLRAWLEDVHLKIR